jgi:hypothetical protein
MPRVDTYGASKVASTALPGARKKASETYASSGGALGEQLAQSGEQAATLGIRAYTQFREAERERADQVANLTTQRKFNELDQRLMHDPEHGYLTKQGKTAYEARKQLLEDFDLGAGEIGKDLGSDKQRLFFEQLRNNAQASTDERASDHASSQLRLYEAHELQSFLDSSVNAAVSNAALPGDAAAAAIATQLRAQDDAIELNGRRQGLGPEQVALMKAALRTQTHGGVIDRLVALEKDARAKEYFESVKDQITDAKERTRLATLVEAATSRSESQAKADAILATSATRAEAQTAINKITDARLRDDVQPRIDHQFAIRDNVERDAHEAIVTNGKNLIDKTGSFHSIPLPDRLKFTVGEASALRAYAEHKVTQATRKTDPHTYYELSQLALSTDPALRKRFQQYPLTTLINQLSDTDFQQFTDAQLKGRAGDEQAARKLLSNADVQNKTVDEALVSMSLDPTPPQPGAKTFDQFNSDRVGNFRRAVREAQTRFEQQQRPPRPATDSEVQSIVDQLRVPVGTRDKSGGGFWGTAGRVPAFAFETPQAQLADAKDIPIGERRRIEAGLRAKGKPITDASVLLLFNALLQQTRKDR